jgi:diaminohydroxyphosphoribosylaminopyrimidine deaminase/5-amino-6-(5-phosphoribosylamino)uracil reductase
MAMRDPHPLVAGQGVKQLQAARIDCEIGLEETTAKQINAPYLKLVTRGRPYVHAKWAMSLDGKIATRTGAAKWISGDSARRHSHELRGRMDAIIVGSGTARTDDPLLTARPPGARIPTRIVMSSRGDVPLPQSQLMLSASQAPILIAVGPGFSQVNRNRLSEGQCEILTLPEENGWPSVTGLLDELGRRQMTNVLVEGGSQVLASFFQASEVNEIHVYVGPMLIGGSTAPGAIAGKGIESLTEAIQLCDVRIEKIGEDCVIHCRTRPDESG